MLSRLSIRYSGENKCTDVKQNNVNAGCVAPSDVRFLIKSSTFGQIAPVHRFHEHVIVVKIIFFRPSWHYVTWHRLRLLNTSKLNTLGKNCRFILYSRWEHLYWSSLKVCLEFCHAQCPRGSHIHFIVSLASKYTGVMILTMHSSRLPYKQILAGWSRNFC